MIREVLVVLPGGQCTNKAEKIVATPANTVVAKPIIPEHEVYQGAVVGGRQHGEEHTPVLSPAGGDCHWTGE